jgi:hypothetical protein
MLEEHNAILGGYWKIGNFNFRLKKKEKIEWFEYVRRADIYCREGWGRGTLETAFKLADSLLNLNLFSLSSTNSGHLSC